MNWEVEVGVRGLLCPFELFSPKWSHVNEKEKKSLKIKNAKFGGGGSSNGSSSSSL